MKTTLARPETATHDWKIVDATDQILGRLAVTIANALARQKTNRSTPHATGGHAIVTNAEKIKLTGAKDEQKEIHVLQRLYGRGKYRGVSPLSRKAP